MRILPIVSIIALFACVAVANARTRESFNDGWEFSRDGKAFEAVRVPHDWAIAEGLEPAEVKVGD